MDLRMDDSSVEHTLSLLGARDGGEMGSSTGEEMMRSSAGGWDGIALGAAAFGSFISSSAADAGLHAFKLLRVTVSEGGGNRLRIEGIVSARSLLGLHDKSIGASSDPWLRFKCGGSLNVKDRFSNSGAGRGFLLDASTPDSTPNPCLRITSASKLGRRIASARFTTVCCGLCGNSEL